ncbi:MAG: sterol desaturase family protein [Myxococcales bacterium]|nr:sterol desaturase family protein [Myxococcales bacterium]MCB9530880.1 sterol desaturase family protein [Myxococcales bacterium]MCB9534336.1 sterol desaturase family protein [Myxococcales bacterium]
MLPEPYADPLFWSFPVATTAVSIGAFALFAAPLTWIALRDPAWARPYRIQERRADPERTIGPSIRRWLANNAVMTVLVVAVWPWLRGVGVHAGPAPAVWTMALQLVAFVFIDDFAYYWMHRAFHTKWLYQRVHRVHHRVVTPWAVTGHNMHPIEFVATGTLALVWPVLFGSHVWTVWAWIAFRQWEAAEGHSGYSFPWSPSKLFPGYWGVEYHDFHHSKFNGNYAGFLNYLDGVFGEYSRGYREYMAERGRR